MNEVTQQAWFQGQCLVLSGQARLLMSLLSQEASVVLTPTSEEVEATQSKDFTN